MKNSLGFSFWLQQQFVELSLNSIFFYNFAFRILSARAFAELQIKKESVPLGNNQKCKRRLCIFNENFQLNGPARAR